MESKYTRLIPTQALDAGAAEAWAEAASTLRYPAGVNDIPGFLDQSKMIAIATVNPAVADLLSAFKSPSGPAAILLTGLPIGMPGKTPVDGLRPAGKDPVSEVVMVGVMELIGYTISFAHEKHGEIVEQVVPIDGETKTNTNSARTLFGWHTDNAFLPPWCRQQIIALLGLINQNRAATTLILLDELLDCMSADLIAALQQPIVRFPASKSFALDGWTLISPPRSVLYQADDGCMRVNGNIYAMEPTDATAATAVAEFKKIVSAARAFEVVLGPGDLLVFKDDAAMHGRAAFTGDRWIQRAYGRFDLAEIRARGREERVLDIASLLLAA